ncbi:hypothetical protein BGZ95_003833 [Linnemannia exigua]|uniref:Uncharacterized protein n=1 Tax=Linnemannia exigua TaxID=604196 RepID=A0AAD4HA99_9FUNG|nr:hypothetical protein BGZ95_003833 [Linnemannia exigua]
MAMEQDRTLGLQQKSALSPVLSDFLGLIRSNSNPSRTDSTVVDSLVAFRQNTQTPLSLQDLTIAFRKSLLYTRPSTLHTKVFVTDWLSDLIKSSSHTKAPTAVIQELAKVSDQLNLTRQETEEWMPLLNSLCNLTNSCLGVVRGLTQSALASFVADQTCIMLASIILETGTRVFRHLDRSQVKRARSEGYMAWNQRTLEMTKSFMEFAEQVLQTNGVREHASDMVIAVCNMLLRYAEDARSEYVYLNMTFKSIVMLVPHCVDSRNIRLEKGAVVRLLCDGVHGTIMDIYRTCVDISNTAVIDGFFKRRWTLAKFYMAHFKGLVSSLFKDICSSGAEATTCRGLLRYLLFFLRGRVCSDEAMRRKYPEIQMEMMKFVSMVEEVIIGGIFASQAALDEEKYTTLQEFSVSSGPRAVFDTTDALTEQEWILGRLHFLLKTITLFDELSPSLQLQLYPVEKNSSYGSPLTKIVESLRSLDPQEFLPAAIQNSDQDLGDIYTRTLTELVTFAHLVQPRQFAKLQIDMIGLVLGSSELVSLLAVDWWTCISARFGQTFTTSQILVLMELLSTLPIGRSSQKVRLLLCSMLSLLDESSQATVSSNLMTLLDRTADNEQCTLLTCFPYECLSGSSLNLLVAKYIMHRGSSCPTRDTMVALLAELYDYSLLRVGLDDWTIVHETLNTLTVLSNHSRYPQLSQRCIPVPARHLVQNIQEMESGLMVPTDDSRRLLATLRARMKCLETSGFSGNTIRSLQNQSREQPSTLTCLSALTTATRYLETLHSHGKVDPVFTSRLIAELAKLQNLVSSGRP